MSRFPRVHFEGALYYITTKADYKLNLFRDDSDRSYYLSLIFDYKSQYNYKLYSLALISNESHLLIEPSSQFTISQIMHDINANYTKYYNKKYERKGHLFEERFKAILIEKEKYLFDITRHIHCVPLKENPAMELKDYKWSSYPCYIKTEQNKDVCLNVDIGEVLSLFSGGPEAYRNYVDKAFKEDVDAFEDKLYRTPVVGTEEFVEKVKEISKAAAAEPVREKRISKSLISVFAVFIVLFLGVNVFLLKNNAKLKHAIDRISLIKDEEFTKDLIVTKQKLNRDLEEKYRADMVSYKVMAARLKEMEESKKEKGEKL